MSKLSGCTQTLIHCYYMYQQQLLLILLDIKDYNKGGIDDLTRMFDELRSQLTQKQHELEVIVYEQYK